MRHNAGEPRCRVAGVRKQTCCRRSNPSGIGTWPTWRLLATDGGGSALNTRASVRSCRRTYLNVRSARRGQSPTTFVKPIEITFRRANVRRVGRLSASSVERQSMTKLAVLAAAAAFTMMTWQAQATPLAAAKQIYQSDAVTLVASGCGVGWHWSPALRRCVRN